MSITNQKEYNSFLKKANCGSLTFDSGTLELVLKPFPAFNYFFGLESGIYFSVPTEKGNLQLRYFDGQHVRSIGDPSTQAIPLSDLAYGTKEAPFFSFSVFEYEGLLRLNVLRFDIDQQNGAEELDIKGRTYLELTRGEGIKGPYYCGETLRSVFLPGERYFLFNLHHCENYQGEILIDTSTGKYKRLPKDSRVYLAFNTNNWPHYKISGSGIESAAP